MSTSYIIGLDQSTQGTKALLFDQDGILIGRNDLSHEQKISPEGYVSHDPMEIYRNTVRVVRNVIDAAGIDKNAVAAIGISNQRETSLIWDRGTGAPLADAVVWQCARASSICEEPQIKEKSALVLARTGLPLSPYFPAAKFCWLLRNTEGVSDVIEASRLGLGTIDSWLIFKLTHGRSYKTDYSNASRTQLLNIFTLKWDDDLLSLFGIPLDSMPEVEDSDSLFGMTDLEGYFDHEIPIASAIGDSHGALFGQGCLKPGMTKATYGTGSSIMMNTGTTPIVSHHGLATSLAFSRHGTVHYVLEGNINYTGAVISWLKDDVGLLKDPNESEQLARSASEDHLYLVPAFSGLGAPYWDSHAEGILTGITRTTGRNEIIRAAIECIAYQITDIIQAMKDDIQSASLDMHLNAVRTDGGPTKNGYLMQFQSDMLKIPVMISSTEELSGTGAAYLAGISIGLYTETVLDQIGHTIITPSMAENVREQKYQGWKKAVGKTLS